MKVAIAGAGNIAQIHAPLILAQPGNELVAITDPDKARARAMCARLGVSHAYTDVEAMLKEQKPQVVHVLTPPQQHAEVAILAMEHGCHVYVEKPLAMTRAEAERMYETARKHQVQICVNHNMVYEATIRKALKLATGGELGEVVSVVADMVFDPNRSPAYVTDGAEHVHWIYRLPGGPLQDQMPHPLSIVLELMGELEESRHLSNRLGVLPAGWDDEIRLMLKGGRVSACVNISLNEKPDTFKLTINGKRGRVTAEPFTGAVVVQKRSCLPRAAVRGLSGFRTANQYAWCAWANIFRFLGGKVDKTNGLGAIVAAFYEALRSNGAMPVSKEKAIRSVDLMEKVWPTAPARAAEESVTLPLATRPAAEGPVTLVTGGAGFVGFYLVKKLLAQGARVRVLVRMNSLHAGRLKGLPVEVVEGDLSDAEAVDRAVQGAEQVYHVGAAMSNKWEEHTESTANGTRYVVESCLKHKVKRMLHVSSLVVYEILEMQPGSLVGEDTPYQVEPRRMGPYTFTKIQAERTVMEAVKNQGLRATIVRPGIVLGPLSGILYPHLGYKLGTDVFLPIGSGHNVLPLIYVENLVDGMIQAMASENAVGKAYNLVDDGKISINEYLERFKTVTGAKSKIIHFPYFMAWSLSLAYEAAAALKLVKPGATSRAQLKWKQKDLYYDGARARQDFGYKTTVPLNEALDKTFRWWAGKFGV